MKKRQNLNFSCKSFAFFLLLLIMLPLCAFGQSAPQEPLITYGNTGTKELGLGGSIQFPMSLIDPPEDAPDEMGAMSIMLQPYFKFFFAKGFHLDVQMMYQGSHTSGNESQESSEQTSIMILPSLGYTLQIIPRIQIDLSVRGGVLFFNYAQGNNDIKDTSPSYGGSAMLLCPISESAVFGTGLIMNWTTLDFGEQELSVLQKIIPIQISWYF